MSAAHGQYVETTILLPDSASALAGAGSLVFHSPTNTVYVGGSDSFVVAVDGRTNSKLRRVSVGAGPHLLCSDPNGNKVYCCNADATVTVIDAATNQPLKTLPFGRRLTDLVYNDAEDKLYCGDTSDDLVRVVDCTADTVLAHIAVGSGPGALCYSLQLNRIYCAQGEQDEVTAIDCAADTVLGTVWVRGVEPADICYDSATNCVYTANRGSSTVSVIDCASDTLLRVMSVGRGAGAIVTGPPGKVYCSNYGDSSLSVITESGVRTVRTAQYPGALSYDAVNQKVYCCAGQWYAGVTVLDAVGDTVVAQPKVVDPTAVCWDPAGNSTYAASTDDDQVSVIGGISDTVEAVIKFMVVRPGPLGYNTTNNHLYYLDRLNGLLFIIDGESNRVLKSIETSGNPDLLLWNPASNKVYLGSPSNGVVTIVDCTSDSIVATLDTCRIPYALCCSDGGKVYVADIYDGVVVIDGEGDSVCAFLPIAGETWTVCYDRTDDKVYVGKSSGTDIPVIDAAADSLVATISMPYMSATEICWNPNHNKLYVSGWGYDSLVVVDCVRDTVLKKIGADGTLGGLYSDSVCDKVYGVDWDGNLRVISAAADTLSSSLSVGNVYATLDNGKHGPANRVYCADYDRARVTVVGAYKLDTILRRISVGSQPSALAWNPLYSRVYVSNYGSSSISVIHDTLTPGVEEGEPLAANRKPQATVIRGVLFLPRDMTGAGHDPNARHSGSCLKPCARPILLDAAGRKVLDLVPGANDVRALAPGVYFVRGPKTEDGRPGVVRKVVLTR